MTREGALKTSLRRRRFVIRQIEGLEHKHSTGSMSTNALQKELHTLSKDLKQIQDDIITQCPEEEFDKECDTFDEIMAVVNRLQDLCENGRAMEEVREQRADIELSLPKLSLPTFSGKYTEWIEFSDLFSASIGSNPKLTGAQKLQYLKGSLAGEAAKMVQHFAVVNANFEEAWNVLEGEYKNERKIVYDLLEKLCDQKGISGSMSEFRELRNTSSEVIRSLKVMQMPVDKWDAFITFVITRKLDKKSREEWNLSLPRNVIPSAEKLLEFLDHKLYAMREEGSSNTIEIKKWKSERCAVCGTDHRCSTCPQFLKAPVNERKKLVQTNRLCRNCLGTGHFEKECLSRSCKRCNGRHHTLLHEEGTNKGLQKASLHKIETTTESKGVAGVLLQTIKLEALGEEGGILCTALLDTGSEVSLIREELAKELKIRQWKNPIQLSGTGTSLGQATHQCCLKIRSLHQPVTLEIKPFIRKTLSSYQPPKNMKGWDHLTGLTLADPEFNQTKRIDLILGAEVYATIIRKGMKKGPRGTPIAQNSEFGWILTGSTGAKTTSKTVAHLAQEDTKKDLHKYFELEEVPDISKFTTEETECEEMFQKETIRLESGRYQVSLPFHRGKPELGESLEIAKRRFFHLENRFKKDPKLHKDYSAAIKDYLDQGHMELVPRDQLLSGKMYLPHHPVIREDKTTTKLRVVFDASARTTNGFSLNDTLMNGPKIQDDLFDILLRFRTHKVALVADIKQMYRNILINPKDKDYQRIIWRENPKQPLKEYRLTTVTFGLKSAPFLATRTLKQLAADEEKGYPKASETTKSDFYVDDLMTGTETVEEAITLKNQLEDMFNKAGFTLTKWNSNVSMVVQEQKSEVMENVKIQDEPETTKTLGLIWCPKSDEFQFVVTLNKTKNSKRALLSEMSRVFDPLGWLSPVTVTGKILMQSLWKIQSSWDTPLPPITKEAWDKHRANLQELSVIKIPRMVCSAKVPVVLYGFADASESAYAAVVYAKEVNGVKQNAHLLVAKTKVAPIKPTTLPRLELCSILLLARLIKRISKVIKLEVQQIHVFSDSTIALTWVTEDPSRWKTFVANRVAVIQERLPRAYWHHINGQQNPADLATRGITTKELRESNLWWNGPKWLNTTITNSNTIEPVKRDIPEEKRPRPIISHITQENGWLERFSSWIRLLRTVAYIMRFIKKCQRKTVKNEPLSVEELEEAKIRCIRFVQESTLREELHRLKTGEHSKGQFASLAPFLDNNGIIRVGGRIDNAENLTPDQKHQILLPHHHHLTNILFRNLHLQHQHAGPQLLHALFKQEFWTTACSQVAKRIVRECVRCVRFRGEVQTQLMGSLPRSRVSGIKAFLNSGVDYAGPFTVKAMTGRGQRTHKAYAAIFVCFATRAVHIETVNNLTTEAFLAALRRFIARRGKPATITSDNGRNFIGANRELKRIYEANMQEERSAEISDFLSKQKISWKFIPPNAPHFGGLWEAGVKSVKGHLMRVMGNQTVTFEELTTILTQIEATLNSRPITPISTDPTDYSILTPGHFLIGGEITAAPDRPISENKNRLRRWQLMQQLHQHFWKRWSQEYLHTLQQRHKWRVEKKNLEINDMILLKEENVPPSCWMIGRITAVHPGPDGKIRVVTVKTPRGTYKRTLGRVCPLPIENQNIETPSAVSRGAAC